MRRGILLATLLALAGCATEPGDWSSLTRPERGGRATADGTEGGYDFDAYKQEQAEADAEAVEVDPSDPEDVVEGLGAEGVEVPADPQGGDTDAAVPAPAPTPEALGAAPLPGPAPAPAAPPAWTPQSAVSLSWGLRLLSTVDAATPPRAILGLPDGSEEVVRAGDMLPDQGVIVLAVGRGVVQLGQVQPQGDHVQVESVFLRAMVPGSAPAAP